VSVFGEKLRAAAPDPAGRRWLFVPYDQLSDRVGPLSRERPRELGIVLVETRWKPAQRRYHRQKLALVLANQRHFALEQAARGVAVRYVAGEQSYAALLAPLVSELGALRTLTPAERELRADLAPLVATGGIELLPHEGWLTTRADFERATRGKRWRMDAFYRQVRRRTGILMENGRPLGGKLSFDTENRRTWIGEPPAPAPPRFRRDAVKAEVADFVTESFAAHPGRVDLDALPATQRDAEALWNWAKRECLPSFGPYEDAMSTRSAGLFHTRIAPLLNNLRLLPARVVADVAALELPIASREGFVRQVLGWREFMRHVHEATDGFRRLPDGSEPPRNAAGAASPSFLGAEHPLPPAFWGERSGLACLDAVVADVWRDAWSHHITRLMVLANLATLLDVSPRALTDWFWVAYLDAYDWVVEPNVLGMGSFALGDLFTTKPYVSGAAYIDRMSDYCGGCGFSPKRDCPVTPLYWAFLARHERRLAGNPRLALPLRGLARRSPKQRAADARVFARTSAALAEGRELSANTDEHR
jgi:deoxyribodipyrimidine photolyase-related protein